MSKSFSDFSIGDYLYFNKQISKADFCKFSELSGDTNLLHHDKKYSEYSRFEAPIVPLHLTALPLSSIVGMGFPGLTALYVKNTMTAVKPVYYNDNLIYTAKIIGKSNIQDTLKLKILVFREFDVVLESEVLVKVRKDISFDAAFKNKNNYKIHSKMKGAVFVTGASGAIGASICILLAKKGFDLVINYREENQYIKNIARVCDTFSVTLDYLQGSLLDKKTISDIKDLFKSNKNIINIIHSACPPIESSIDEHMEINFCVLKEIVESSLPNMLKGQNGKVIFIGSTAIHYNPTGWENYVAAKVAASNYIDGLHKKYSVHGIGFMNFSPSYVKTKFSEKHIDKSTPTLLPEQVAEGIVRVLSEDVSDANYIWKDDVSERYGQFEFSSRSKANVQINRDIRTEIDVEKQSNHDVDLIIHEFFGVNDSLDLSNSGVDQLAGWDSMKHIELMLFLERKLGISFTSTEMDKTNRYSDLVQLIEVKLANKVKN